MKGFKGRLHSSKSGGETPAGWLSVPLGRLVGDRSGTSQGLVMHVVEAPTRTRRVVIRPSQCSPGQNQTQAGFPARLTRDVCGSHGRSSAECISRGGQMVEGLNCVVIPLIPDRFHVEPPAASMASFFSALIFFLLSPVHISFLPPVLLQ